MIYLYTCVCMYIYIYLCVYSCSLHSLGAWTQNLNYHKCSQVQCTWGPARFLAQQELSLIRDNRHIEGQVVVWSLGLGFSCDMERRSFRSRYKGHA